ncbi:MAG: zinc ribbon domain-containing protein [Firmicutes bacterium]|nr:zinc ribbon domain-containing protein [Bacillota bacterium]
MRICPNCGVEVADSAKFCRRCGTKMAIVSPEEPQQEETVQEGADGAIQPLQAEQEAPAFEGTDYQWGPPTGGENYDEQAMPAVLVEEEEAQEEAAQNSPYTYRLDAPGWDHTSEFKEEDISRNKVTAMAAYMLGAIGVVIALIAGKDSPYADFHMRQGLKIAIVEAVLAAISVLLCWTLIVPGAAAICIVILMVIRLISFVSVCKGRAVEPPILRSFGFLK